MSEKEIIPEITILEHQIYSSKDDLKVTKGCMDSGTVACRLWHSLDSLIGEAKEYIEESNDRTKELECFAMDVAKNVGCSHRKDCLHCSALKLIPKVTP